MTGPVDVTGRTAVADTAPADETPRTRRKVAPDVSARVVCHVVAEAPFLVAAFVLIARGWRPTQDDAVIATRSWAVLTAHPPLVGQITQATGCGGHVAFKLGPLVYWMLALPVRLDPGHGVLWGAAIWAAVAMALCVEAAWAVRGATAGLAVAAYSVLLAATWPIAFVNAMWDPYFGLVWLTATCVLAWAVGTGRLSWWPVLVLCASVAAQSHLEYTLASVLLALAAPIAGLLSRRRSQGSLPKPWPWLPVGLGIGAACWVVPLAQEAGGSPGNMSVLVHCLSGQRVLGARFGLSTVAAAVAPPPVSFHGPAGSVHDLFNQISARPSALGVAVLVVLGGITLVAWRARRGDLAVLAGVALVVTASLAWGFARQPANRRLELTYLEVVLWPAGVLVWAVGALALRELAVALRSRTSRTRAGPARSAGRDVGRAVMWVAAAVVAVGGLVNTGVLASRATGEAVRTAGGPGAFRGVSNGAEAVERLVPRGPVMIFVSARDPYASYALMYGVVWVLVSEGRQATVPQPFRDAIDPPAAVVGGEARVALTIRADGSVARAALAPG